MLELLCLEDYPSKEWEELVCRLDGNPIHLPILVSGENERRSLRYLLFKRENLTIAIALAFINVRKRFKIIPVEKTLALPTPPAFDRNQVSSEEISGALIDFARHCRYGRLQIHPRWGLDYSCDPLLSGSISRRLTEFCIDLSQGLQPVAGSMHKSHRKNIRTAERMGIEVSREKSLEEFLQLRNLQESSSERASSRGNPYSLQSSTVYESTYAAVYKNGPGRFMLARQSGKVVAGLAYVVFGRKAITVRSGATREGYNSCAMYLIHDLLFKELIADGITDLNIGGVPAEAEDESHPQHGLFTFKKYFGGVQGLRTAIDLRL